MCECSGDADAAPTAEWARAAMKFDFTLMLREAVASSYSLFERINNVCK